MQVDVKDWPPTRGRMITWTYKKKHTNVGLQGLTTAEAKSKGKPTGHIVQRLKTSEIQVCESNQEVFNHFKACDQFGLNDRGTQTKVGAKMTHQEQQRPVGSKRKRGIPTFGGVCLQKHAQQMETHWENSLEHFDNKLESRTQNLWLCSSRQSKQTKHSTKKSKPLANPTFNKLKIQLCAYALISLLKPLQEPKLHQVKLHSLF